METERKPVVFTSFIVATSIFLLLTGPIFVLQNFSMVLVEAFGLLLILWALIVKRLQKHHTKHKLPKGYFFLAHGPYEIIRHPIYAGYLLIMMSVLQYNFTFLRVTAFIILLVFVFLRILREEHAMEQEIKEYKEYKGKTKALIPYLL